MQLSARLSGAVLAVELLLAACQTRDGSLLVDAAAPPAAPDAADELASALREEAPSVLKPWSDCRASGASLDAKVAERELSEEAEELAAALALSVAEAKSPAGPVTAEAWLAPGVQDDPQAPAFPAAVSAMIGRQLAAGLPNGNILAVRAVVLASGGLRMQALLGEADGRVAIVTALNPGQAGGKPSVATTERGHFLGYQDGEFRLGK